MNKLKEIVQQAIDIHVHIGPEIIPRKYTTQELIRCEEGKIKGMVLKNHFYPSSPFIAESKLKTKLMLFGSIVLNNYVGGLNPEAIYAASLLLNTPLIVFFPTTNASNFLKKTDYEIAPEWVQRDDFTARRSSTIAGIWILKNNQLTKSTIEVLKSIKKTKSILATGHISAYETERLVEEAIKRSIKKIVITHPIYQKIDMSVAMQKKLSAKGCFIEICYSMYSIDKISISKIARQIRDIGIKNVILSSDVGQSFSPSPSEALKNFVKLLLNENFTYEDVCQMIVVNPTNLLNLKSTPSV